MTLEATDAKDLRATKKERIKESTTEEKRAGEQKKQKVEVKPTEEKK